MLQDLDSANIEILDRSYWGNPASFRFTSDKGAGNNKWTGSGLKAGDTIRFIAGSEEAVFTLNSDFLKNMTGNQWTVSTFGDLSLSPYFTFSSTAVNFDNQITAGTNVMVKLQGQAGNESAGFTIVVKE